MPHSVLSTSTAFDEVAINYDAAESCNPIFQWMRRRVQSAAASTFDPGARLLEIGCGTGADALFFARRGHRVVAVEPSPEMLAVANEKIAQAGFSNNVAFRAGGVESTKELIQHHGAASFDGIFSNFGALNCVQDLRHFARDAAVLLPPGGKMLLNVMPPICPWEIFYFLSQFKPAQAFRRWRGRSGTGGLAVRLGNRRVQTFYHSRRFLAASFFPFFEIEKQFALGLFVPPPYLHAIARRQKIFTVLLNCDEKLAGWPLLRNWGDHVVVILRRRLG
jgi:ubiquinone/menaquinone biosynthesis C-methylase UbiE